MKTFLEAMFKEKHLKTPTELWDEPVVLNDPDRGWRPLRDVVKENFPYTELGIKLLMEIGFNENRALNKLCCQVGFLPKVTMPCFRGRKILRRRQVLVSPYGAYYIELFFKSLQ